ncbi:MerR family transcriptional regulator [Sediminivirga luteola]|uniref:MerR family transcriptional regulator n=1 Tax=Sediminivirga luteola TaxID=1774748 RepID=A0A8J2XIQ5_9MICO|nr:MerR family transcriptional regulator [Sediminivirga luteola]GGA02607.1 MerR family transcriptional regulator [Sediminivirga luteola]
MLIGDLSRRTGVSTRALRHYEDQGLLRPERDTSGYRRYDEHDITRVAQIRTMLAAGMNTAAICRFLDCARSEEDGVRLEMCPDLRAQLDALQERLESESRRIRVTQERLGALTGC